MPELLFLHNLDEAVSTHPAQALDDAPPVPPYIAVMPVWPSCLHTLGVRVHYDAEQACLWVACIVCPARLGIAIQGPTAGTALHRCHAARCVTAYQEGELFVYCFDCSRVLSTWDVAPYTQEPV
jgi:hypothetical protein